MSSLKKNLEELKDALKSSDDESSELSDDNRVFSVYLRHSDETVESTKRMLDKDPRNRDLLDWYAFMLYSNGRFTEASNIYKRLLSQQPKTVEHVYYLGCSLYRSGHTDQAVVYWKNAVILSPSGIYGKKAAEKLKSLSENDWLLLSS